MIAGHAALLALKVGPAGQADLRPRRGHARDDEAASGDRPPSHRRDARRPADRDGHRRRARRRRLRDAERRRAVARRDSRERPVPLRSRPRPRPRDDDQHAAERRVPRVRRAADAVCRRSRTWTRIADALGIDPVRLRERNALRPGDTTATGQTARQGLQRARGAARGGDAGPSFSTKRRGATQGIESRHRAVAVLPRLRLHRRRRGEAGVEGLAGADRARRADSRRPAPRSARARGRCTRRSSPTRWAFRTSRSR